MIWDFHCCGETLREIGRVLDQTIMCSVNLPAQAATGAEGDGYANSTPQPHPHVVLLARVWLWRNYIPSQGVTVMPGAELNLSAPVIFAVPAPPAAGHDALPPPLEVKFTVPVLLAVTVCVVPVGHGGRQCWR